MIADKFVDLYARNAGLRDKLVAERDVVWTYAVDAMIAGGVMSDLAFKGGTCLRKVSRSVAQTGKTDPFERAPGQIGRHASR